MTRAYAIQTNFTAGELSPRLAGRVDFAKYFNGVRRLENMVVMPHGGVTRRPGFRFVASVKDGSRRTRLIRFEFSTDQAYMLEFGHLYVRVFKDEGQVESSPGVPVEIATPYSEDDLPGLKYAQSADTLYLVHPSHAPTKITRTSHIAWTRQDIAFVDGPYRAVNGDSTKTMQPAAVSGASVTITAAGHAPFAAADVGRCLRLGHSGTWGWAVVTGYISETQVTVEVKSAFAATTATADWRLGLWGSSQGWPAAIAFYEQRLFFAGAAGAPDRIDGSRSADFETFAPGISDDDPLSVTIATDDVQSVRWLSPGSVLLVGTVSGEFEMRASTADEPLTPVNVQVKRQTTYGSADHQPRRVGNVVLFIQRAGRKLRELVFTFETDGYVAPDLTLLAEHVTRGGLREIAYAQEPDSVVWCARADGTLLGLTYERPHDVVGWHRHVPGGSYAGGPAQVESVATIPAPTGDHDQLWVIVRRTIGGQVVRHVEFMEEPFGDSHQQADSFFVDSGLSHDGAAVSEVTGLDHLNGETVSILADGAVLPDQVVADGRVYLSRAASCIHVGLPYTSTIESLGFEGPGGAATMQGRTKRVVSATIRLYRSLGLRISAGSAVEEPPFRHSLDVMGSPPALFTGDRVITLSSRHGRDSRVVVEQSQPLPLTIIALMQHVSVSGD
ncbi:MAG: hypothetical protein RIE31_05125 [Alphaproteobacteria bacterium]